MKDALTKAETVALWHAVSWMGEAMRSWREEPASGDEQQVALLALSETRLKQAKKALRKVNQLRKMGL